jgi:hypothetical protein
MKRLHFLASAIVSPCIASLHGFQGVALIFSPSIAVCRAHFLIMSLVVRWGGASLLVAFDLSVCPPRYNIYRDFYNNRAGVTYLMMNASVEASKSAAAEAQVEGLTHYTNYIIRIRFLQPNAVFITKQVDCRLRPSCVPGAAAAMVHRLPKAASPQRKSAIIAADAVSHSESPAASPGVHSQPPYNYILIVCSSMGKIDRSMTGRFFRADILTTRSCALGTTDQ